MKSVRLMRTGMLLLTALIWGSAFVAQSVGMDYVGPFTFNGVRSFVGGIVLIPVFLLLDAMRRRSPKAESARPTGTKKDLWIGGICCGVCLFAAATLQQFGISMTTVGKAGFITAMYIVLVPILGLFLKKRVRLLVWIAVVLAAVGLYLLCMTDSLSFSVGDLLVLACALLFAVHILVIDHFSPKVDGVRMSCIQFWVCGLLSVVPMLVFEQPDLSSLLAAWMPILYAGVLSSGVAYTLQIVAQKDFDPTVASLLLSLESVFSVLSGWLVLGQSMSGRELLGCGVMFVAIILAQLPARAATDGKA